MLEFRGLSRFLTPDCNWLKPYRNGPQPTEDARMTGKIERVVVTGMGVSSPLGCNLEEFWNSLLVGQSGVKSLDGTIFYGMETRIGAIVLSYNESSYFEEKKCGE